MIFEHNDFTVGTEVPITARLYGRLLIRKTAPLKYAAVVKWTFDSSETILKVGNLSDIVAFTNLASGLEDTVKE